MDAVRVTIRNSAYPSMQTTADVLRSESVADAIRDILDRNFEVSHGGEKLLSTAIFASLEIDDEAVLIVKIPDEDIEHWPAHWPPRAPNGPQRMARRATKEQIAMRQLVFTSPIEVQRTQLRSRL